MNDPKNPVAHHVVEIGDMVSCHSMFDDNNQGIGIIIDIRMSEDYPVIVLNAQC
jgi:hypothetical protein